MIERDTADQRRPFRPEPPSAEVFALPRFREFTDLGNAHRLIDRHGVNLRCVPALHRWYTWDGRRWAQDDTGEVHRRAQLIVEEALRDEYVHLVKTKGVERAITKAMAKHLKASGSSRAIAAMVREAEVLEGVAIRHDELDRDGWLLNVNNGTLDLRTGTLREHRQVDLVTRLVKVDYNPTAECPRWEAFVAWAMCDDVELIRYVRQLFGYSLTGDVTEQILPFCHGAGENGKSTMLGVFQELLGLDDDGYALQAAPRLLLTSRNSEHPTNIADLAGRRFVVSQEAEKHARLDEALVKQLTGGDPVKGRKMREDFFTFRPTFKLWLAANAKPKIQGTDHAIWRRMRLIPFAATVTHRDNHLADKLRAELEGILAWAVTGCADWQANGLTTPNAVTTATNAYRANEDHVGRFITDRCDTGTNEFCTNKLLREAYITWCTEQGEPPLTLQELAAELLERGHQRGRVGRARDRGWHGIGLADPNALPLDDDKCPRETQNPRSPDSADTADTNPYSTHDAHAQGNEPERPSALSASIFDDDEVF